MRSKPNAEMQRFAAKRGLTLKAAKGGGELVSDLSSPRQGASGILGIKNKEGGRPETWGAWGKVIGERCGNCSSAQV